MYTWSRKYRPRNLKEFVDQEEAKTKALMLVKNYRKGGKAILLYGPPGTGKTSLAYALAGELGLEIIEINASDMRDAKTLRRVIGEAMKQKSFFYKGKIILIDEIDGISGSFDRGGVQEINRLIKESSFPVILTANDPWDKKFKDIRKSSVMIELKKLSSIHIRHRLEEIAKREGLVIDQNALSMLARNSAGDLRGAINDLEVLSKGNKKITIDDVKALGYREREVEIFEALIRVLKSTSIETSIDAFNYVNMDLNELMLWLEKNIPKEYTDREDLFNAFNALSIADIYLGKVSRRQYYRLWVYASIFMSAGVAIAKKKKYEKFTKLSKPTRILKIWMNNQKTDKEKQIIELIARKSHTSMNRTKKEIYPYIKKVIKEKSRDFSKWLRIDESLIEKI